MASPRPGRRLLIGAILIALLFLTGAAGWIGARPDHPYPDLPSGPFAVRIYYDSIRDIERLSSFDLWETNNLNERYVLAGVDQQAYARLVEAGWRISVDEAATASLRNGTRIGHGAAGYRSVDELYAHLDALEAAHPDLVERVDYGESYCQTAGGCQTPGGDSQPGYPLRAIRITNEAIPGTSTVDAGTVTRGEKPIFFLMAAIHAREITTPELAIRLADWLLDDYGQDADITWLVDWHEVWIVPVANPDGRWLVELGSQEPYYGELFYQRKNANRDTDGDDTADCTQWPPLLSWQYGVDLNRNHSFGWGGAGSSGAPCEQTYRGPSAASENEVAQLEGLLRDLFPDQRGMEQTDAAPEDATGLLITLHSFGDLVLYPWGNGYEPAPNRDGLKAIGDKLASYNGYVSCQPAECLYVTSGSTDDWAYGELGLAALTFEVGDQFMPQYDRIDKEQWPANRPAFLYAAKIARTPYLTAHGPTVDQLAVDSSGPSRDIEALVSDVANGDNAVAGVVYAIDTPHWVEGNVEYPLSPADGAFDSPTETVAGTVDTRELSAGQHTLFVRGQDAAGNWGPATAAFFEVEEKPEPVAQLDKVSNLPVVEPGGVLRYTIQASLAVPGTGHPFSFTLSDPLPASLTVLPDTIRVNGVAMPSAYLANQHRLSYETTGTLDNKWGLQVTFQATVSDDVTPGDTILNEATATAVVNGEPVGIRPATAGTLVWRPQARALLPLVVRP